MRYVVYIKGMYSVKQVNQMAEMIIKNFPTDDFIFIPAEENKIELLEPIISLKQVIRSIVFKLQMRFR